MRMVKGEWSSTLVKRVIRVEVESLHEGIQTHSPPTVQCKQGRLTGHETQVQERDSTGTWVTLLQVALNLLNV